MTLYFTALTTRAVVSHPYLAGDSGDPNRVASNGNPVNVASMQAALDQERQHAALLGRMGATSASAHYYFPASTFTRLGYTRDAGTFLWVVDQIETALIGAYLAAIRHFSLHLSPDLTQLASRILGTEAQHRVMGRMLAGDAPANNMGLEVDSFTCVGDAAAIFEPYVTGSGFAGGATSAVPLPASGALHRVIGQHTSH